MLSSRSRGARTETRSDLAVAVTACLVAMLSLPAGAEPAAEPKGSTDQSNSLTDVTVTAQRREQKLQDVGISVTALDAETLSNLNITTATDIIRAVPSLKMNSYGSAQVVFNVRGVSQNDYGDQQEPPVAVYQDDSYSSSINTASFPVFDLARVEVLRGPQGTLFGRNATGGAIQFVSRKPTKDLDGYAKVTVGNFGQLITEGAISGPLTDVVQARLAAIRDTDDGYIKSVVPGVPDRGANNHYALRGQFAWQPSSSSNVNLAVRYLSADRERQAGLYSLEAACPNAQYQGEFLPATVGCAYWGTPPGATGTGYRNDAITPSRGGDPWATAETTSSYVNREMFGTTVHADVTMGDVTLLSITDYVHARKYHIEGGDSSPDAGVVFYQGSNTDQMSEELRLSGQRGPHQWVAGVYGMYVSGDYTAKFATPFDGYDPTVAMMQRTTSVAAFAQDEWQLTDKLKLIGGLRYWHDTRQGGYNGSAPGILGVTAPVTIIFNTSEVYPLGSAITPADAKRSFNGVTARLQLDYKPSEDTLVYASYNRGSKSGGFTFSTGTPFDPDGSQTIPRAFLEGMPYREEVLDAYELGLKSTLASKTTLDISAFHYKYKNYQAFAQVGPIQTVKNLDARENGLEVELRSRPLRGLTVQLGVSLLDSTVYDILLPDGATAVNHDLPQAPHASGNALGRYEFSLGAGVASLQVDAQYSERFCFTVLCAPVEREGAYTVTNARLGYGGEDGRWDVAAFVNNVFDEKYRVYAFDNSLFAGTVAAIYAKPRTYGLSVTYRFGRGHG